MKSIRQIFRETFGKYVPYLLLFLAALAAIWIVNTYFERYCGGDMKNTDRQIFICYVVIGCTCILSSLMIYLFKRIMEKLDELKRERSQ